jgi:hypothetical protein
MPAFYSIEMVIALDPTWSTWFQIALYQPIILPSISVSRSGYYIYRKVWY